MPRWEYRVLHDTPTPELNELGDEGWEVVTVEFDDEGEILNALAKRSVGGGGDGGGRGGGGGGGGGGGQSRRRRRNKPQGGGGGGGGGGGHKHPVGPME